MPTIRSSYFQDEINAVDSTKVLTFVIDPTYTQFEWSYNGLECRGGTPLAVEYAASELLEAMGFRWYSSARYGGPPEQPMWGTVRPITITTGLVKGKTIYWMYNNTLFLVYGQSWGQAVPDVWPEGYPVGVGAGYPVDGGYPMRGPIVEPIGPPAEPGGPPTNVITYIGDRRTLEQGQLRWAVLNNLSTGTFPAGHRWMALISPAGSLSFFQNNPQLIRGGAASMPPAKNRDSFACSFDLMSEANQPGTANFALLVHWCAAKLLQVGWNVTDIADNDPSIDDRTAAEWIFQDYGRTGFDPTDGDQNLSKYVYKFSQAVALKMREGTPAISWAASSTDSAGSIPAQPGKADAAVGVYAYAGHRRPPEDPIREDYTIPWDGVPGHPGTPMPFKPGVYIQVALAFNRTGLTYQELLAGYEPLCDSIMLRDYWDTQLWSQGQPLVNGRAKTGSFDSYDGYHDTGAFGVNTEFAANWFANLVMTRYGIRKIKTGLGTFEDALDDIMLHLFQRPIAGGEDPAVRELLEYWGNRRNKLNKYNIRRSFDMVNAMEAGSWYRRLFEQYMVISKRKAYLPPVIPMDKNVEIRDVNGNVIHPGWPTPLPNDPYPAQILQFGKNLAGVRMSEIIHSYAQIRADLNVKTGRPYPHLWWGRLYNDTGSPIQLAATKERTPLLDKDGNTIPNVGWIPGFPTYDSHADWQLFPEKPTTTAELGSESDFQKEYAIILADTPRDVVYDEEDAANMVLVRGVTPVVADKYNKDAPYFACRGTGPFAFIGPGRVVFTESANGKPVVGGEVLYETYGNGLNYITAPHGQWVVSNEGGELFFDTFGGQERDPHYGAFNQWLYIPNRAAGAVGGVNMEGSPRFRFYDRDQNGVQFTYELIPVTSVNYKSPNNVFGAAPGEPAEVLGPGQITLDNGSSRGKINNLGANRWLSKKQNIVLVPKIIADEDFANRAKISVVPA